MRRIGFSVVVLALAVPGITRADDRALGIHHDDPCPVDDGIVGYRPCPGYGAWGTALEGPYVFVRLGFNVRHLPRTPMASPAASSARTTMPVSAVEAGSDASYTMLEQISMATSRLTYVGLEMELSQTTEHPAPGARTFDAGGSIVGGLHGGSKWLNIGAELAAGGRFVNDHRTAYEVGEGVLEARARVDLSLSPWFTIGADAGVSLLDRNEWFTGLCLGIHSYSYGGN